MFEKVNPSHPDKIADRIAGALVDYCYRKERDPKCAFEVLIGHGLCTIIGESSVVVPRDVIKDIVDRISCSTVQVADLITLQDEHLEKNQEGEFKTGDNGIFKGVPISFEEAKLTKLAKDIYSLMPFDGKYLVGGDNITICQSNTPSGYNDMFDDMIKAHWNMTGSADDNISTSLRQRLNVSINPIGDWTGGLDVDTGATNRKLGSDMGRGVTGGGLHGKDLSKADVTLNILCHLRAQEVGEQVTCTCSIGQTFVRLQSESYFEDIRYSKAVEEARAFLKRKGGFEKLAEWGLIC